MQIGSYFGNDPGSVQRYENWLGRPVDNVLFYLNQSSWTAFDSSISWATGLWKSVDRSVIWSVPLTVEGTSLASVANGEQNGHFLSAAQQLAATRPGDGAIVVRLGWEANGSWMPWAAEGHEADFKQAYQTVVNQFRSVSNRFQFVWDINAGGLYDPSKAYPGDGFVETVGTDFYYNTQWDPTDPAAAFAQKVGQNHGLQWISDFANAHGKKFAVSEWGVSASNAGVYVQNAAAWFQSHNVAFANYWETNAAGYDGILENGSKPGTASAFLSAFGPSASQSSGLGLVLRVSADAYLGDAKFTVTVDGKTLAGVYSTHASHAAGQVDTITIAGDFSAANSVAVNFINDYYAGSAAQDRNLYVHSIAIGSTTIAGNKASNSGGIAIGDAAGLFSNGSAYFTIPHGQQNSLSVTVSEDAYHGDAQFRIFVDGAQVGDIQTAHASHALGKTETLTVSGLFSSTPNEIRIDFVNDLYGGNSNADRNLFVHSVSMGGHDVRGSIGSNSAGWNSADTANMYSNGSLTFHAASGGWWA